PIWFAVNTLLVESLRRFHLFYGDSLQVECPTGSGEYMHLGHVAEEIQHRLHHIFVRGEDGRRAVNDRNDMLDFDEHWKDYIWFYEFFDADTGRGLGASHQCGWTGLIAKMIHDTGLNYRLPQTPRTPTAAAAHYFDDVFSRSSKAVVEEPRLRRSSTSRSIGNRNSFYGSIGGDRQHHTHDDDDDRARRKSEADDHLARHVTQALERLRTQGEATNCENELETSIGD
ncbi:MAG: hypothetical protein Q9198_010815, partial [Flavoplaca austrocitrina]